MQGLAAKATARLMILVGTMALVTVGFDGASRRTFAPGLAVGLAILGGIFCVIGSAIYYRRIVALERMVAGASESRRGDA
jgi:hypothetical protein